MTSNSQFLCYHHLELPTLYSAISSAHIQPTSAAVARISGKGRHAGKRIQGSAFTARYHLTKLEYFEAGSDIDAALFREKQIKAGSRKKKVELVTSLNPEWKDLFDEYFQD